jgi:transcription factor C subunit 6
VPAKPGRSTSKTGSWSREVGVHSVTWRNGNGLGASCLLSSSTASGLCRIDVLLERLIKNEAGPASMDRWRMVGRKVTLWF